MCSANVGDDKDSQARQRAAISNMFFCVVTFNMFVCVCHVRQKCELANRSESTFLRSEREWRGEARRGEAIGEANARQGQVRQSQNRAYSEARPGIALGETSAMTASCGGECRVCCVLFES